MFRYIFRFIPTLLTIIISFVSVFGQSAEQLELDIAEQVTRIAELEQAYLNGEIPPVNEADFFDGDLAAELDAGLKFNEISFIATHNSYQKKSVEAIQNIFYNISDLTFGLVSGETGQFNSQTLTQQFNCGIRSIEMDIETIVKDNTITFTCMHSPTIDMTTTCYDFALALKEISLWSDNNPGHLPITVIVEPKSIFLPIENMEFFNMDYAQELDKVIRANLGDKLFTPADMLRDYNTFGEMRAADDWCRVDEMLGKVLILLHETGVTEDYIALDPTFGTQAMFPMLREKDATRDCASFLLINEPKKALECKGSILDTHNLIVRTRADSYGSINENKRESAISSGSQIISTDYPMRDDLTDSTYVFTFGNQKTMRSVK
ncbi:MAG: hypothetical protein IIW48_00845 [Clostridia bacterium]|nr:hypothetical protein [Clostridia bacterium]